MSAQLDGSGAVVAGVWRLICDLPADDLFLVLNTLRLVPVRRGDGLIVSLCPCCFRPGATWTPKATIGGVH
jgi:hypothetical protein